MVSSYEQERALFRLRRPANVARLGILAASLALLSGCANTEPMFVNLIRDPAASGPADEHPNKRSCRIVIASVTDDRPNRETLGVASGRPLIGHSVADWVARALRDLGKSGYSVDNLAQEAVPSDNDLLAEVSVRRAYVRTFLTQFEAVVALKVKFSGRQDPMTERDYRASAIRLNMVNGNVEVAKLLNDTLAVAVRSIGEDIERICDAKLSEVFGPSSRHSRGSGSPVPPLNLPLAKGETKRGSGLPFSRE